MKVISSLVVADEDEGAALRLRLNVLQQIFMRDIPIPRLHLAGTFVPLRQRLHSSSTTATYCGSPSRASSW